MMVPVDRWGTRQRVDLWIGKDGYLSFIQIITLFQSITQSETTKAGDKGFGQLAQ